MAAEHEPTDDIFYDLVSIQYHALQGAELYGKYLEDAHDHEDIAESSGKSKSRTGRGPSAATSCSAN